MCTTKGYLGFESMLDKKYVSEIDGHILDSCSVDQNKAVTPFKLLSWALAFLVDHFKCQNTKRAISSH